MYHAHSAPSRLASCQLLCCQFALQDGYAFHCAIEAAEIGGYRAILQARRDRRHRAAGDVTLTIPRANDEELRAELGHRCRLGNAIWQPDVAEEGKGRAGRAPDSQ